MYDCKYPHLFEPVLIGNRMFRNRIFASPTGMAYKSVNFTPHDDEIAYYERKAIGGAASVCMGDGCVDMETGCHAAGQMALDDFYAIGPAMSKLASNINRHGAISSVELNHCGGCSHGSYEAGYEIYGPVDMETRNVSGTVFARKMPLEIMKRIIDKHYISALNAKRCGFGMITIHGGHGWLLSQFMSPTLNTRDDEWGGTFENRMRLPIEIVKACRRAVGPGFPIEIRISGAENFEGGYDIDYGIKIAEALDGLVDIIHVSTGSHENDDTFPVTHPSMFMDDGCNVKYAAAIKPHIKKSKVATVGALSYPEMMEEIIASGKADIVEMARGLICDPDLPVKARTGRDDEIRHCMRCFACFSNHVTKGHMVCAQNPELSNELEFKYTAGTPKEKKKVLVVGGGVAGMQAAITAKQQGHDVVLCEKSSELGGVLRCERSAPFKANLEKYLDYQANLVKKLGVDVRLNTAADPEYAKAENCDVIICALGADTSKPPIPGIDGSNVVDVTDCYRHPEKTGKKVVILGGGLSGTELAILLNKYYDRDCVIVEMMDTLGNGGNLIHGIAINKEVKYSSIDVRVNTMCTKIDENGVWVRSGDAESFIDAETVVVALGMRSRSSEAAAMYQAAPEFYMIGDCSAPRNIQVSTDEAYHVASDIGRC